MRTVLRIDPVKPSDAPRRRVAAYCRVSAETERLSHSMEAQESYYGELIRASPEWEFAGVYADRYVSGTRAETRPEFQRLLADCRAGAVDVILTKSVSRFCRNTLDLLKTVRFLKGLGISVRFEKENIDSLTGDGELMLTILAGFAEEESRSISSNLTWAAGKRFEQGIQWHKAAFGYRWDGKTFIVQPKEAEAVRRIFADYLAGVPVGEIVRRMKQTGFPDFSRSRIAYILQNEVYRGDVLLQKTFRNDPLSPRKANRGELPSYYMSENHEAIVPGELWDAAQERILEARGTAPEGTRRIVPPASVFSGKIVCGKCGSRYTKGVVKRGRGDGLQETWICSGKKSRGIGYCDAKNIRGDRLREAAAGAMGLEAFDERAFAASAVSILAKGDGGLLEFRFTDGRICAVPVETYSRSRK